MDRLPGQPCVLSDPDGAAGVRLIRAVDDAFSAVEVGAIDMTQPGEPVIAGPVPGLKFRAKAGDWARASKAVTRADGKGPKDVLVSRVAPFTGFTGNPAFEPTRRTGETPRQDLLDAGDDCITVAPTAHHGRCDIVPRTVRGDDTVREQIFQFDRQT